MGNWVIGGIIVVILAVGGYVFFVQEEGGTEQDTIAPMQNNSNSISGSDEDVVTDTQDDGASDTMAGKNGSYSDYSPEKLALAHEGKVLLYFHADWCPICRPLDAEFRAKESTLSGVHILKVDYDTATALKQKYGVTYQHTFVQVDAGGNLIAKWGDATNLAAVLARVQ
ncbi:MAG TPA: thioredoxin family protein [Candidatus Paceibacterota bacterium]|nr:thioredoxin family protein [Candidatus Paceibacterota bacterium]